MIYWLMPSQESGTKTKKIQKQNILTSIQYLSKTLNQKSING